ncbi:MAG TPA: sugar nucleotide-binding protein [Polyangiaceae bacterium]
MTWLVTGAGGQVGSVLLRLLAFRQEPAIGVVSPAGPAPEGARCERLDLADERAARALLERCRPRVIVHVAALASVAAAARDPAAAHQMNAVVTEHLARLAHEHGARFVYTSTDMVFDGQRAPYAEHDAPEPGTAYGRSKLAGERATLSWQAHVVVRLPLLYGVPAVARQTTFLDQMAALREQRPLSLFDDEWRTPLWLEDAARALIRIARSSEAGVLHLAGPERLSRLQMGRVLAHALGVESPTIHAIPRSAVPALEARPRDLSLSAARYTSLFGEAPGRRMAEAIGEICRARA